MTAIFEHGVRYVDHDGSVALIAVDSIDDLPALVRGLLLHGVVGTPVHAVYEPVTPEVVNDAKRERVLQIGRDLYDEEIAEKDALEWLRLIGKGSYADPYLLADDDTDDPSCTRKGWLAELVQQIHLDIAAKFDDQIDEDRVNEDRMRAIEVLAGVEDHATTSGPCTRCNPVTPTQTVRKVA